MSNATDGPACTPAERPPADALESILEAFAALAAKVDAVGGILDGVRDRLGAASSELLDREQMWTLLRVAESTFDAHKAAGRIGPRPILLGSSPRWVRREVVAWLETPNHRGELYNAQTWPAVWRRIRAA